MTTNDDSRRCSEDCLELARVVQSVIQGIKRRLAKLEQDVDDLESSSGDHDSRLDDLEAELEGAILAAHDPARRAAPL